MAVARKDSPQDQPSHVGGLAAHVGRGLLGLFALLLLLSLLSYHPSDPSPFSAGQVSGGAELVRVV